MPVHSERQQHSTSAVKSLFIKEAGNLWPKGLLLWSLAELSWEGIFYRLESRVQPQLKNHLIWRALKFSWKIRFKLIQLWHIECKSRTISPYLHDSVSALTSTKERFLTAHRTHLPQAIWDTSLPMSSRTLRGFTSSFMESWPSCPQEPAPKVNTPPLC